MLGGCEALVASVTDSTKMSRKKAVIVILAVLTLLAVFLTKSFDPNSAISTWKFAFGFGLFDFVDFISEGVCMPIAAVLLYFYAIWKWGFKKFKEEVNVGAENAKFKIGDGLAFYFKYILPVFVILGALAILRSFGIF